MLQYPTKDEATIRWLQRDETTFYMDEMELKERWQYYISSFVRVEPTEGVNRSRLQRTVLSRNLPASDADSEDGSVPAPLLYDESLTLRICLNSSKIVWEKGTSEWFIYNTAPDNDKEAAEREERIKVGRELRKQRFIEKMVMNSAWMRDMDPDEVRKVNEDFQKWIKDGTVPPAAENKADDAAAK